MEQTIVSPNLTIEGEITSDEQVVVQGTVRGKLSGEQTVVVEQDALVEADVTGSVVVVAGTITGDVTADDRVDLQAGGKLIGDVKTARLTIADGASFKGSVDMDM